MGDITTQANEVFRDFNVDGVPASGANDPPKPDTRTLFQIVETAIAVIGQGLLTSGAAAYDTLAHLDADLLHGAGAIGWVNEDGANNGLYVKSGVSGSGSWSFSGITVASIITVAMLDSPVLARLFTSAGVATFTETLAQAIPGGAAGAKLYSDPTGDVQPVFVDAAGALLIGISVATGKVIAALQASSVMGPLASFAAGVKVFTGANNVQPIVVDAAGNVLLGVEIDTGNIIGAGLGGASSPQSTSIIPLATGDRVLLRDWNGALYYGQSNSTAQDAVPVISSTQPAGYPHLTFTAGVRATKAGNGFGGVNPGTGGTIALVETASTVSSPAGDGGTDNGETECSGAANYLTTRALIDGDIAAPGDLVIFASAPGHGNETIAWLSKSNSPGVPNNWYQDPLDHVAQALALATGASKTYACHTVSFIEGENDGSAGTSRATYGAALGQLYSDLDTDILAITSQSSHVHMLVTQQAWKVATNNGPVLGTFDQVNANSRIHFVLPNYGFGPRAPTNPIHFAAIAHLWMAHYHGRAQKQLLLENRVPDCVWPISATAVGQVISVKFRVPQFPLVLDLATLAATQDYGFVVTDGTGTLTLSDIQVVDGDTVQITVDRALGTTPQARYALDNLGTGLWFTNGASGNLRDSTTDSFTYAGKTYPLWHLAPHFELPIIPVDPNS